MSDSRDQQKEEALRAGIRRIWQQSKPIVLERIDTLERAHALALAGRLTDAERAAAEREAHKLAGSLGTFGLLGASDAAAALEAQLADATADIGKWPELIGRMRREVDAA